MISLFNKPTPKSTKTVFNKNDVFNKNQHFYVCSSGGCGSTIILGYLSMFGNVHHIHDRYPPDKLCYIGGENTSVPVYNEWFNKTEIPEDKLGSYKVIFLYRNPIEVIFSRFIGPNIPHLQHIKCDNNGNITLNDVIKYGSDLYKLENFFDNYTIPKKRNYAICCVKYENFFNNINEFNYVLGIPNIKALYPIKHENLKKFKHLKKLMSIYNSLTIKMNKMKFIEFVIPINDLEQRVF